MATWKKRGPILGLAAVCVMVAAYATGMPVAEIQKPLPSTIADLGTVSRVEVALDATVVLSGQFGPETVDGDEIKREAVLAAAAGNGTGEAEVELDTADRAKQELEIEVEGLTVRTTYQVLVDGHVAGTFTTDVRGKGSLELSRNTNQE
jgi:hypothetical protein